MENDHEFPYGVIKLLPIIEIFIQIHSQMSAKSIP